MSRNVELEGKLSVFSDPLKQFSKADLAAYVAAGFELGLVPSGGGGVGMIYVDRGDPAGEDKNQTTLTGDGAWHQVNLSAIVPAAAKFIQVKIDSQHATTAGKIFAVRKKGNANGFNVVMTRSQVAGVTNEVCGFLTIGADGIIEYYLDAATTCSLTVMGWML